MKIIHKGFDTITLAIQANIPPELDAYLSAEKEQAEAGRAPRPISYGGADFDLAPHGGNGYRYLLKSGPLHPRWSFKKPNARDPWGVQVSLGSTLLATQGLGFARAQIDKTLTRLGLRYGPQHVSLSRADFCVDIFAPNFELNPENFVIHSHTNRADHLSAEDRRSNGKSGKFTSVTVGKIPGRQVIIYDKRREVIDKKKPIWWDIWNANLRAMGAEGLNPKDRDTRIWRVEVRAGKDLLKDRWNIRRWAEFDDQFGDVMAECFEKVRYCEPDPSDTNRARWPNHAIWDLAKVESDGDLTEMRSHLEASQIKEVQKADQIKLMMGLLAGNAITLAALQGASYDDLENHMDRLAADLKSDIQAAPTRAENKLDEAKARYRFIG